MIASELLCRTSARASGAGLLIAACWVVCSRTLCLRAKTRMAAACRSDYSCTGALAAFEVPQGGQDCAVSVIRERLPNDGLWRARASGAPPPQPGSARSGPRGSPESTRLLPVGPELIGDATPAPPRFAGPCPP